jgi:hypothetical protein
MSIVSRRVRSPELRQEFHVQAPGELHFTPDGVSKASSAVAINIALLTEGRGLIKNLSLRLTEEFGKGLTEISGISASFTSFFRPKALKARN